MAAKPDLLYISPVIPALTGNGLAMRAGTVLEALAARYEVDLLVAPLYGSFSPEIPEPLQRLCRRSAIVSPWQRARTWSGSQFDVVHVFRLAMLPFSRPYLGGFLRRPRRHLDLDDIESVTRRRLAALYRQNGEMEAGDREESEAARQEAAENEAFGRFDRVYVCSELDRQKLDGRTRAEVRVLCNAVRLPDTVPSKAGSDLFTFLFAGTLGYYPNEDAARWLCGEIVPRIRGLAGSGFAVDIVGTGASDSLRRAVEGPQVRFVGAVPDMGPRYAAADAVVAPVRAGGGTRIKILEAFSYRTPVVSTPIGIEGIDARHEEHVLIGDTADAFAGQCARLMRESALTARLATKAFGLVAERHTIRALERSL